MSLALNRQNPPFCNMQNPPKFSECRQNVHRLVFGVIIHCIYEFELCLK